MVAVAEAKTNIVELTPKMKEFITCDWARYLLFNGGRDCLKSTSLVYKLVARAAQVGAMEGLCRDQLTKLRASTLRLLIEGSGTVPPALSPGRYDINKVEQTIRIHGGGTIYYFGLDDPNRARSLNLTGCAVEEWSDLTDEHVTLLDGSIRAPHKTLTPQMYGATNPGPASHHLGIRFGLTPGATREKNHHAICTTVYDNPWADESRRAPLERLTGLARDRWLDGLWVSSEGLVYDQWDRQRNIQTRDGIEMVRWILAIDDGYTNPFTCLRIGIDGDGRMHVFKCHYQSGLLIGDRVSIAKDMSDGVEAVVIDPAAADLKAEMRNAGLPVVDANNEVAGGIDRVQQRLPAAGDNLPRLTVDPSCADMVKEFETYRWAVARSGDAKGAMKDKPVKEMDHSMDALRYGVMHIDAGPVVAAILPSETKTTHSRDDWGSW